MQSDGAACPGNAEPVKTGCGHNPANKKHKEVKKE